MKLNVLHVLVTVVATSPAVFGMHYSVSTNISPVVTPLPPNVFIPPVNNVSLCTSASNTVAVGYEIYSGGFRMLCADAGRIGFWTAPLAAAAVGVEPQSFERFLCPSGTALAGVQYIDGLIFPFPLCGELIPDFKTGFVHRTVLFTVDKTVVEYESKTAPVTPGVISCGPEGWVQSLAALRNSAGIVSGFSTVCNTIVTAPANLEDVNVDLAVRTVNQRAVLDHNSNEQFRVDIFNLGIAGVLTTNVTLELRFDGLAWQLRENLAQSICTNIMAHKGPVDMVVVGKRCRLSPQVLDGRGGVVSATFLLEPAGSTAPVNTTPQAIVTAKVALIDESLEGADPNATNDLAAFPVSLK